jgi:hypothetical protein
MYLSSMAAHLDGLAALGDRERVERYASPVLQSETYLEPFALRALGIVRQDDALVGQAAERFEDLGLEWHAARTRETVESLVLPVIREEFDVVETGLRSRHRDEHGVLISGSTKRPRGLRRNPDRGPGLEVDDFAVELPLRPTRDEEIHLFLDLMAVASPVRVPLRCPPAPAEALVRDGEVLQAERLAHEADLEVSWIHTDLGRHIWHVGYSNAGVVGHGFSSHVSFVTNHTTARGRETRADRRRLNG